MRSESSLAHVLKEPKVGHEEVFDAELGGPVVRPPQNLTAGPLAEAFALPCRSVFLLLREKRAGPGSEPDALLRGRVKRGQQVREVEQGHQRGTNVEQACTARCPAP